MNRLQASKCLRASWRRHVGCRPVPRAQIEEIHCPTARPVDLVLAIPVETGQSAARKAQIGVRDGSGSGPHAAWPLGFRPRGIRTQRRRCGPNSAQHRVLSKPGDKALVGSGGEGCERPFKRLGMLEDAPNEIQAPPGTSRQYLSPANRGLAVFPDRHVDVPSRCRCTPAMGSANEKSPRFAIGWATLWMTYLYFCSSSAAW